VGGGVSGDTVAVDETKVVINACYGGFSLSAEATREYLRRAGKTWTEEESEWSILSGPHFHVEGERYWSSRDLDRTDPILVAIVEEWGERAFGQCAALEVRSLSKGTFYRIDEYDGFESIETRDGIDWRQA
jgi:hypothetical protein